MEEHGCALEGEEVETHDHRQTDAQKRRARESLPVMPMCVKLVHFMCQHSPVGKFVTRFDSDTYAAFFPAYLLFSHLISNYGYNI